MKRYELNTKMQFTWSFICQNENEYYGSPANPVCHGETWWNDTTEPGLKCLNKILSDFVPDTWALGEKDVQSIFNYYCFDEYITTLETAALRSQAESAGAIFQLEDDGLMPHKVNPDSASYCNGYFHQVRASEQW